MKVNMLLDTIFVLFNNSVIDSEENYILSLLRPLCFLRTYVHFSINNYIVFNFWEVLPFFILVLADREYPFKV